MLTKLNSVQLSIVSVLLEGYLLFQVGSKSGNLLKEESGIENPHPDIRTVNVRTIKVLQRNKMIELKRRQTWNKWFGPTKKAERLFLSLYNTENNQITDRNRLTVS